MVVGKLLVLGLSATTSYLCEDIVRNTIGAGIYSLVRGGSSMLNLHQVATCQVHRTGVIRSEHNPSLLMEI